MYEKYKALADKSRLTAAEKESIEAEAAKHGIAINKNCPSCYRDAAAMIALKYKPNTQQTTGDYELCDDIDITIESYRFGILHVCKRNCTRENVTKWLAAGLPLRFFKRIPDENNQ